MASRSLPLRSDARVMTVRIAVVALLGCAMAACASLVAPVYHGALSDHFDGRRFHNSVRFRDSQIEDALRRAGREILRRRGKWPEWEDVVTDVPPRRVGGGALRVTFVNHATVLIQVDSLNILTDPVWSQRVSPFRWYGPKRHRPPGIRFEDLPPIDVVLLSHNHYDHMDLATLRRLVAAHHPLIITGLGNAAYLARNEVPGARDIDWWQTISIRPGLRITGVPAQHWSARSITDKWRTLWLGFVVEGAGAPIYFAGDTGFGEFFRQIRERFGPFRFAMLPIAPQRPREAMAPRHMSASDAVRAYEVLDVGAAMALHFGTFQQGSDSEREPVDSLRQAIHDAEPCAAHFRALRNGEAWSVPPLERTTRSTSCARHTAAQPGRLRENAYVNPASSR
jgi:L-ascorbate metabolism protein UlaG (beta-lactamase superfamily)